MQSNENERNQCKNIDYDEYKLFKELFSNDYKTVRKPDYEDFIKWKEIWYTDDVNENKDENDENNKNITDAEDQNMGKDVASRENNILEIDTTYDSYVYEDDDKDINSYINSSTLIKASLPLRAKKLPSTRRLSSSSSSDSTENKETSDSINKIYDGKKKSQNMPRIKMKPSVSLTSNQLKKKSSGKCEFELKTAENETLLEVIKKKSHSDFNETKSIGTMNKNKGRQKKVDKKNFNLNGCQSFLEVKSPNPRIKIEDLISDDQFTFLSTTPYKNGVLHSK